MSTITKGQAAAAAVDGFIDVIREGRTAPDRVSVDRAIGAVAVAGDWLLILEDAGQLWAVARLGTAPGDLVDVPGGATGPEGSTTVTGTDTVAPTWSGTYRGGSWRSDTSHLVQGPSSWGQSRGAAFYGRKLQNLAGNITSLEIRCERLTYGTYSAQSPTMALLGARSKPSGFPSVLATATGPSLGAPGTVKWWSVPTSWLDEFDDGTAGGIGIVGTGNYMRLDGPGMRARAKWKDTR